MEKIANRREVDKTHARFRAGFSEADAFDLSAGNQAVAKPALQAIDALHVGNASKLGKDGTTFTGFYRCARLVRGKAFAGIGRSFHECD